MEETIRRRNAFLAHITIPNYRAYGPIEYHIPGYGYSMDPLEYNISKMAEAFIKEDGKKMRFAIWKNKVEEDAKEMCERLKEMDGIVLLLLDEDGFNWYISAYESTLRVLKETQ